MLCKRSAGNHPYRRKDSVRQCLFLTAFILSTPVFAFAQNNNSEGVPSLTLGQCIDYGLQHQPLLNQAQINEAIAKTTNAINLSGWLPQVSASANAIHYFTLPTTLVSDSTGYVGTPIQEHTGIVNTVVPELSATQVIFNPQLLYAAKSANLYIQEAKQVTDSTKIFVASNVSKSFYSLLLTLEQINVLREDTARLTRNVKDTYHQFVGGIVDETDYDEAVIALNNSYAQLVQQLENVRPQYAVLKQIMGYPPEQQFNVSFDSTQLLHEIDFDTTRQLQYDKRIEYQQLITAKKLQHQLTNYYGLAFLPTVSAFYNYFYEFENDNASSLFSNAYPYSYIGLTLNVPIFTGFSRVENVHKARLQEQLLDWAGVNLKSEIYAQYTSAMGNYKYNLTNWHLQKDNVVRSKNVYRIVTLQYKQGIVAYLNVIAAESYLIAAETGEVNALYQLLSSKVDLEKALGDISYNR